MKTRSGARGLPPTFFLTSGMIGSTREFWWDELERLLLGRERLPARLEVPANGQRHTIDTGFAAAPLVDPQREAASDLPWEASPETRLGLFDSVWRLLQRQAEHDRSEALAELRRQLGSIDTARPSHRTLTREEVVGDFARGGV